MATKLDQRLDERIEQIQDFLVGFRNLPPGKEARSEYIKTTVGDAEHYLHEVLVLLRDVRKVLREDS